MNKNQNAGQEEARYKKGNINTKFAAASSETVKSNLNMITER